MKEGYWININTGQIELVQEHASFLTDHVHAQKIGLPENVYEQLKDIPNDYSGPNREKILRLAMAADLIRLRGHGQWIAIEFTAPTEAAFKACRKLLDQVCGPFTVLMFSNLQTGETVEFVYKEFDERMKQHDL